MSGFEFYFYQRDPTQPGNYVASTAGTTAAGVSYDTPPTCATFENNKFSYSFEDISLSWSDPLVATNVTLRRNVIVNSYATGAGHSSDIFIAPTNNFVSDGNFYDSGGWDNILSAYQQVTYTNSGVTGQPAVFTWPSAVLFINTSQIQCTAAQNGIPLNTTLFVENLSGSTFNVSTSGTGTPLLNTTGAGTIQCYWIQPEYNTFNHNKYVHDGQPWNTLTPASDYGDISMDDSSENQWRQGGPQVNTFTALSGAGATSQRPHGQQQRVHGQ